MANNYYKNAHLYFVEVPLTYGGSLSVAPGKYVEGSADTGATFPRLAALGILSDEGVTTDGDTGSGGYVIGLDPSLLIFSEPQPPLTGAQGDTGAPGSAVAAGDTGATGSGGAKGDTGTGAKGDTGAASTVAGDTGAAGAAGDTGAASTVAGDTGASGAKGDTGVGVAGDTGATGPKGDTGGV